MRNWTMWVVATVLLLSGMLYGQQPDISGNWQGTLQAGRGLRWLLKITKDDGKYKGVMYYIDQTPPPIPLTTVALDGKTFTFTIKPLDISYTGTLNPDGETITGNASENGQIHVLNLQHVNADQTWAIPEPPKPMAADAKPKFDVVTIKPGIPNQPGKNIGFRGREFRGRNFNVDDLIGFAYGLHAKQIIGGPDWLNSELFDITGMPDTPGVPSMVQMNMLMADLLTTRFHLQFHYEKREMQVYALTVTKGGPKMTVSTAPADAGMGFGFRRLGDLIVRNMTMKDFAKWMQGSVTDRPVIDKTGLIDRYDFTLKWTPDQSQFAQFRSTGAVPTVNPDDPNAPPSLYTAMQEQLGLKMDATKADDEVMVIDHIEQPSAN